MTQSDSDSNSPTPPTGTGSPPEIVKRRLSEAGLDTERLNQLQAGSKAPISHDTSEMVNGRNYGVMAGDGLIIVDIDSYQPDFDGPPEEINTLPDTLTVSSPHGGEHRYYAVNGDVANVVRSWGEVRAENQYVVGPGSDLTDCKHGCCTPSSPGRYAIQCDQPIASVDSDALPTPNSDDTDPVEQSGSRNTTGGSDTDLSKIDAEFDVEQRLEKAMSCKYGWKFRALWEGRHQDAGYDDRSRAETALGSYLAWWMNDNETIVAALMDRAETKKWAQRGEGYRQSLLDTVCDHSRTYEPGDGTSLPSFRDERPEVSYPTLERVQDALLEMEIASVEELIEHDRIDRSEVQIRRALNHLVDEGMVEWERKGRQVKYYLSFYESTL